MFADTPAGVTTVETEHDAYRRQRLMLIPQLQTEPPEMPSSVAETDFYALSDVTMSRNDHVSPSVARYNRA